MKCDCTWLLVGHNNLPDGVVLSVPVTFADGKWSVLFEVTVGDELKERLQLSASELRQVCVSSYKNIVLNTYSHSSVLTHLTYGVIFSQEKELGSENGMIVMNEEEDT